MSVLMISIVIVEDTEDIQTLLSSLFNKSDEFELLLQCYNGVTALREIPTLHPDVVLMDIGLPDISGVACIAQLKRICTSTEFVVFTVSEQDEVVFEALQAGATSYLMKSTKPEELMNAIKEVHNGGSPISSDIARKILKTFYKDNNIINSNDRRQHFGISRREEEMLKYLSEGYTYQEAAAEMYISVNTLKTHIFNTYEKLQVNNKMEAIKKYFGK